MSIHTRESIAEAQREGAKLKFVFFWGDQPKRPGIIDHSCFSQWFASPFTLEGETFETAEHAMMFAKAKLFGDDAAMARILKAKHPGEAKLIGREVRHFEQERWEMLRFEIVVKCNLAKFKQNAELRSYLIGTGNRVLVEASPRDKVWGIGLPATDPNASIPAQWPGLNLLGFALMEVRRRLTE